MAGRLEGKRGLISGAGWGIGLATPRRFVLERAWVTLVDLDARRLTQVLAEPPLPGVPAEMVMGTKEVGRLESTQCAGVNGRPKVPTCGHEDVPTLTGVSGSLGRHPSSRPRLLHPARFRLTGSDKD